ncbi:MAG: DUF1398 family protein [Pseudomonadota bacterium]
MQQASRDTIDHYARSSYAGTISFGEVVMGLMQAGVESYFADYRAPSTTWYLPSGESYCVKLAAPAVAIPAEFDAAAVQAAIRGAQSGKVKYPGFMALSMAAGCVGYMVWIAGRHVSYFGRKGEVHIEPFPASP